MTLGERQRVSVSLFSMTVSVTVSRPADGPWRAWPAEKRSCSVGEPGFGGEQETERHRNNMKTRGFPFVLFWLFWGHSCALAGKGRKKKIRPKLFFKYIICIFILNVAVAEVGSSKSNDLCKNLADSFFDVIIRRFFFQFLMI